MADDEKEFCENLIGKCRIFNRIDVLFNDKGQPLSYSEAIKITERDEYVYGVYRRDGEWVVVKTGAFGSTLAYEKDAE